MEKLADQAVDQTHTMDQAVALKDMEMDQVMVDQAKTTVLTTPVVTETTEVPAQALLNTLITTTAMIWGDMDQQTLEDLVKIWDLVDLIEHNENLKMISKTKILQQQKIEGKAEEYSTEINLNMI